MIKGGLGFYLRQSDEEICGSIECQRRLLREFAQAHPDLNGEITEYIDDTDAEGRNTGVAVKRPAFDRMIEDAKRGSIHTILIGNFSVLSEDTVTVGIYLEQIFPLLGLRLISVEEGYDSGRYDSRKERMSGPVRTPGSYGDLLRGLENSERAKSSFRTKWEKGIGTSGRVPYGYVKDAGTKGGWAVDPEAAEVVKLIFEKANENWSTRRIVDFLNGEKILTPGVYREKKLRYSGTRKVPDKESLWDIGKVRTILKRYAYTGAQVQNNREKIGIEGSLTRAVPENRRHVTENAHPAIVSREVFEAAQAAIRPVKKPAFKMDSSYPLKGKVRCGVCHLTMIRMELAHEAVFYCPHKLQAGKFAGCHDGYIPEKQVERAALSAIYRQKKISPQQDRDTEAQNCLTKEMADSFLQAVYVHDTTDIRVELK